MDSASIPNLFLDPDSSDVQLRIGTSNGDPETVVPAHSLVLRTNSVVFRAMFDSAHFKEGRTGVVELKVKGDLDDAIFFLRYLYTRELEQLDLDVYISLLQTAHLYDVYDLVKLCNERIVEAVTPLTVCRTYETVRNVASENLLDHCKDLMIQFAFLIFWKDLHLILDDETMSFLLASDRLSLLDEDQALGALWRWGCTRRVIQKQPDISTEQRIAKLLPLIRESFLEKVPSGSPWYGLLASVKSDDAKGRRSDTKCKMIRFAEMFRVTKEIQGKREFVSESENSTLLKFSVDRDILLAGFSICVSLRKKSLEGICVFLNDEYVSVNYHTRQVTHEYSLGVYSNNQILYVYDLIVELKTPVLLRKSEFSLLSIMITGMHFFLANLTNYVISQVNSSMVSHDNGVKFSYTDDRAAVSRLYCFG